MEFENKPNSIQIELVHGCNKRCSYCGTMGLKREFIFMEEKTLMKICALIKNSKFKPRIILGGAGEPTLHPNLLKMLKIIRMELHDLHIQLITNGFWIKKYGYEFVKELLKFINDVAVDDYDSDIDENLLKKYIFEFNNDNKENVDFKILQSGVSFYADKNVKKKRVLKIPAIDLSQNLRAHKFTNHCGAGMPQTRKYNDRKCTTIFRSMIFRCDGNVPICCDDFRCEYLVCNILENDFQNLEEVWFHPRFESARRVIFHNHRKFIHPCDVCATSTMREGFLPHIDKPTKEDFEIVNEKSKLPYEIVKREWEISENYDGRLF